MTKQILIYKCEECPYAHFDRQDEEKYWGNWCCQNDDIGEPKLLTEEDVSFRNPKWCPLDNYC
jgi:hypothetical protein